MNGKLSDLLNFIFFRSLDEQASGSNRKILDPDIHFFSDTELTAGGNADSRNNSPSHHLIETVQSDSEIEMKNRKGKADESLYFDT